MSNGLREWAAWNINWEPARQGVKRSIHAYARARGAALDRFHRVPQVATVFGASAQKAGSQWLKALFSHPIVTAHSGLLTLPQQDYKLTPPARGFPAGTFVPGLYLSYPEYLALPKPYEHRVVYLSRDPRDMVVSGYWSGTKTHRVGHLPEVEELRANLRAMPFDDALLEVIRVAVPVFRDMETWIGAEERHPEIARFRLEDVNADMRTQVPAMLAHTGVVLSAEELGQVLADVDRSALQAKDLAKRGDGQSHYRVKQDTFRDVFKPEHYAAMNEVAPGLAQRLGYDA